MQKGIYQRKLKNGQVETIESDGQNVRQLKDGKPYTPWYAIDENLARLQSSPGKDEVPYTLLPAQ